MPWLCAGAGYSQSVVRGTLGPAPPPTEMAMPIRPGHWLLACFHMCFLTEPSGHTPVPRGTMRLQGTGTGSRGGIHSLVGCLPNPRVCWGLAVTLHPSPSPPPPVLGPESFGSFFSVRVLGRSEPLPALLLLSVGRGCYAGGERMEMGPWRRQVPRVQGLQLLPLGGGCCFLS